MKWSFRAQQYSAVTHLIYNGARIVCEFDAEEKTGATDLADHFVTWMQLV